MKHILFFATKEDLLPILRMVEAGEPLSYTRAGNFVTPALEVFSAGADIPNLGRATAESSVASASYLVCLRDSSVKVRVLNGRNGVQRYLGGLNRDSHLFPALAAVQGRGDRRMAGKTGREAPSGRRIGSRRQMVK